jgi:FAD:protein FMN transferase
VRCIAMGSECSVDVVCSNVTMAAELESYAHVRLIALEHLWSRFLDHSEISRINRSPGCAVPVSPVTIELLLIAVEAWHTTNGIFCPFAQKNMVHVGYDKSFSTLRPVVTVRRPSPAVRMSGTEPIGIDVANQKVAVEAGFGIDLGGIAKGFAADLISDELIELGAYAAMVSVGGDVACRNARGSELKQSIRR